MPFMYIIAMIALAVEWPVTFVTDASLREMGCFGGASERSMGLGVAALPIPPPIGGELAVRTINPCYYGDYGALPIPRQLAAQLAAREIVATHI